MTRERAFLGAGALLFVASAAGTVYWCGSMTGGMVLPDSSRAMGSMDMPSPGAGWLLQAACFMGLWVVMMLAMMLPTLVPALSGYRGHLRGVGRFPVDGLTAAAGAGYFLAWTVPGALGYAMGLALAAAATRWPVLARTLPLATGVALLLAGAFQLSAWKAGHLRRCRAPAGGTSPPPDLGGAWRYGLRLGAHCILCCLGYTVALFALGVMDLRAMAIVAAAITAERLLPRPRIAAVAAGLLLLAAGGIAIGRVMGAA